MTAPTVSWTGNRTLDTSTLAALVEWAEVYALLAHEVHLLDERQYEQWVSLFTGSCLYWMPVDPLAHDPALRLNVFYDDRRRLEDRVARLTSGSAFSEQPPSLTARTFSAMQVAILDDAGKTGFVVKSTFSLVAQRRDEQRHFGGRYLHRLVREGTALRIAEKRVTLLGSDVPQRPMTFIF